MTTVALLNPWPQPGIVTPAGAAGCSIVVLDAEHGVVRPEHAHALVLEGRLCGVSLWVRAPGHDPSMLAAYLDGGVDGIVAPRVSTPAQAEAVVQAVRYPPRGKRGIGPTPDNAYFLKERRPSTWLPSGSG